MKLDAHRRWLLIILLILAVSGGGALWIGSRHQDSHIAEVLLDDQLIRRIDLDAVKQPYTFRVDCGHGAYNDIRVTPGAIAIVKANCPDQICVHQGPIHDGVTPIVCLPHRLLIRIDGAPAAGSADVATDTASSLDATTG